MQRRALGVLFLLLAAALVAVAVAALVTASGSLAGRLVVALAALAIGLWLGSAGLSALRR
ncbi:MAG TPA: hypothetical protein VFA56_09240 [Gaiellaceae bacterium]|nr:hypothetical protein [Gaiellaceae bacterium]